MKAETENKGKILANIRFIYIVFYLAFIAVMELIPVCNIMNVTSLPGLIYNVIAVVGGILLLIDFCTRGVLFKPKYAGIMILFFVTIVISIIANLKYGFADNLKTLVWSAIQIFLVAAVDMDLPKEIHIKHFKLIADILAVIWTIAGAWSIGMFVNRYGDYVSIPGDSAAVRREGFIDGRLFGVFTDPNYAAIIAFTVILLYLIFIINGKNLAVKIIRGVVIFINYCYVVLSASRTVEICVYIAAFLAGLWGIWILLEKKNAQLPVKIAASVANAAVCLVLSLLLITNSVTALSMLPAAFDSVRLSISSGKITDDTEADVIKDENKDKDHSVDMTRPELEDTTDITNNRMYIWTEYLRVFGKAWLTGTSPRATIQYAAEHFDNLFVVDWNYSTHNAYLSLFVCTGLFGGLLAFAYLVLIVIEILGYLIRQRKNIDDNYIQVMILTLILVAYAVCAFSYQIIFFNNMFATVIFWMLLGYTRAFARFGEPEREYKRTLPLKLLCKCKEKLFKKA